MLRRGMVFLVDRDDCVDHFGGDDLLVYNWLDGLVDVMMNVFALDSGSSRGVVSGFVGVGRVFELGCLSLKSQTSLVIITVMELPVDGVFHHMVMLLGEDLLMLDGLDGGVIVILVDFAVDSFLDLLMVSGLHVLAGDGWSNVLGDVGGVTSLTSDAGNSRSSLLHPDRR